MKLRSYWQAAAVATCAVVLGCGRNPQSVPEKAVDATPPQEPVVAVAPPGEHSDPSLVDSTVTANLDVNAPWTSPDSATPQASAPAADEGRLAAAPASDEGEPRAAQGATARQASAPDGEPAKPSASPQAAVQTPTVDLAKSRGDSRTSTN